MKITTREATDADATIIADFNASMAKETENIELNRERLRQGVEALIADSTKGKYYLAEADGKVVGQLLLTYEWSDWRNATFWWIQSVYVHPKYRHQGIFRSLYRTIETIALKNGDICGLRLYVEKTNQRAQQTYESLGMKFSHYQMMDIDITV